MNNSTEAQSKYFNNKNKRERTVTLEHYFGRPMNVSSTRYKKRKMENNETGSLATPKDGVHCNAQNESTDGRNVNERTAVQQKNIDVNNVGGCSDVSDKSSDGRDVNEGTAIQQKSIDVKDVIGCSDVPNKSNAERDGSECSDQSDVQGTIKDTCKKIDSVERVEESEEKLKNSDDVTDVDGASSSTVPYDYGEGAFQKKSIDVNDVIGCSDVPNKSNAERDGGECSDVKGKIKDTYKKIDSVERVEESKEKLKNSDDVTDVEGASSSTVPYDYGEGAEDSDDDEKKHYSDSWEYEDYDTSTAVVSKGWTSGWSTGWTSGWSSGWSSRDWTCCRSDGMEEYRKGYPKKKDCPSKKDNYRFYTSKICSRPDAAKIDDIHKDWWGAYDFLEEKHGYIQWIFPIRESGGMNFYTQELQKHEAQSIIEDKKAHKRVLTSYRMMLDFFGMELSNCETGEITRSKKYRSRFRNLNNSYHNYLRITRILKSLGEFDYEYLKKPWLKFLMNEIYVEGTLCNAKSSFENYWVETIKDDADRAGFIEKISEFNGKSSAEKSQKHDASRRMGRRGKRYVLESSVDPEVIKPSDKDKKPPSKDHSLEEDDDDGPDIPSLLDPNF